MKCASMYCHRNHKKYNEANANLPPSVYLFITTAPQYAASVSKTPTWLSFMAPQTAGLSNLWRETLSRHNGPRQEGGLSESVSLGRHLKGIGDQSVSDSSALPGHLRASSPASWPAYRINTGADATSRAPSLLATPDSGRLLHKQSWPLEKSLSTLMHSREGRREFANGKAFRRNK